MRVTLGDRPLHDQELIVGPGAPGWDGTAVLGGRRAAGAALVVDPEWDSAEPRHRPTTTTSADAALPPLDGPAVLLTALAHDALTLRRRLDSLLTGLDRGC